MTTDNSDLLSNFKGRPVLLIFHPNEWDPAKEEILRQYKRILSDYPSVEFVTQQIDENEIKNQYGLAAKKGLVLLNEMGEVEWTHVGSENELIHPEALQFALKGEKKQEHNPYEINRRDFLKSAGVVALFVMTSSAAHASTKEKNLNKIPNIISGDVVIQLQVNGVKRKLTVEPRVTLLDALRERLNLTGTKKGCDHGQCGACTVHVNGKRINSCLMLAMTAQGKEIVTIEGLAKSNELHPLQTQFIEQDAFQCGYCTSGQIMSGAALIHEPCGPNDADVRECMSGNICRRGAYNNIVKAIQNVRNEVKNG